MTMLRVLLCMCLCMCTLTRARPQDECAEYTYTSLCLKNSHCNWCCDAPFGSQCFSAAEQSRKNMLGHSVPWAKKADIRSGDDSCSVDATLSRPGQTCAQMCRDSEPGCESCQAKRWCYFCRSNSMCQSPEQMCPGAAVVQRCNMTYDDTRVIRFVKKMFGGGLTMMLLAILISLSVHGYMWHSNQLTFELTVPVAADAGVDEEQQPLLHNHGDEEADEEEERHDATRRESGGSHARMDRLRAAAVVPPAAESAGADRAEVEPPAAAPSCREGSTLQEIGGVALDCDAASTAQSSHSVEDEFMCYLCLAARSSVVFLPCHHLCCCESCSNRLRPNAQVLSCPFCRRKIDAMVSLQTLLLQSKDSLTEGSGNTAASSSMTSAMAKSSKRFWQRG